jgi:hypothetical protein
LPRSKGRSPSSSTRRSSAPATTNVDRAEPADARARDQTGIQGRMGRRKRGHALRRSRLRGLQ